MKYKKVLVFTKTLWNEPPRIRHQLTRLLLSRGHDITFFERSSFKQFSTIKYIQDSINFIRHFELFHHQLRPFSFLIKLNQYVVKNIIKNSLKDTDVDLIINFNYDYDFLKDLFPTKKIVTIINDDFVAQAKPWMENSISKQLRKTCEKSDLVFTVHYSLQRDLKKFNKNTHLLFPWATHRYINPVILGDKRDVVLFWGYIDHRVNWDAIQFLLNNNIKFRFIGNIEASVKNIVKKLSENCNFELFSAMPIENVNLSDVSCSIIPYDINIKGVQAISVSNRTFQLLSFGIPIVHANLPDLIKTPETIIKKCETTEDYYNAIHFFNDNFNECQSDIKIFMMEHYSDTRYEYIINCIKKLK